MPASPAGRSRSRGFPFCRGGRAVHRRLAMTQRGLLVNGRREVSQVMVDKVSTLPRSKVCLAFGRLEQDSLKEVDRALLLVLGLT